MSKPLPPSRVAEQFVVRFPDGMRDRIADAAKAAGRSMNAEIVHRLEQSFERATLGALGVMRSSKGRVSSMMDIYQRDVAELRGAKQALADARAKHNDLMVEMLQGGEDARSRGTLRDELAAENERIRTLEREIARLEDNLSYSAPQPTEEEIEAHFKNIDAMRAAEDDFKPTK